MDPGWLSNAYLVADEEGGTAVFVDSGAPMEPLHEAAQRWNVEPRHVLRTHAHPDHVAHEAELGPTSSPARSTPAGSTSRRFRPPATPTTTSRSSSTASSASPATSSSRTQSAAAVDVPAIKRSVMEVLMELPPETARPPRPHRRDDDRPRVGAEPFVRYWRDVEPANGAPASLAAPKRDPRRAQRN